MILNVSLAPEEVVRLRELITDDLLQDGWYEMDREEFDLWMSVLRKLGSETESWELEYEAMEAEETGR